MGGGWGIAPGSNLKRRQHFDQTCQIFSSLELSFLCYDASWGGGASRTLHHHLLTNYAPPLRLRHFPTDLRLETDISRGYFLFQFWTQWTFLLTIYAAMFPFWLLYCIAYLFIRRKFVFATPGDIDGQRMESREKMSEWRNVLHPTRKLRSIPILSCCPSDSRITLTLVDSQCTFVEYLKGTKRLTYRRGTARCCTGWARNTNPIVFTLFHPICENGFTDLLIQTWIRVHKQNYCFTV